jgi:hypothetical protein
MFPPLMLRYSLIPEANCSACFLAAGFKRASHRPFYPTDLQRICLSVRQSGIGWNGKYALFYRRTQKPHEVVSGGGRRRKETPKVDTVAEELLAALGQLGLSVTLEQVQSAVAELYPSGLETCGGDDIRKVFSRLRRPNSV